jgi:hypothetical protein
MTTNPSTNWQHTAVGKFFDIVSRAAGQRADLTAKMSRRAELVRDLASLQRELADLEAHHSSAPVLFGREADRNRSLDHAETKRAEIARCQALLSAASAAVDAAMARNARLSPLVNSCATLMHKIGLLSREEAQL